MRLDLLAAMNEARRERRAAVLVTDMAGGAQRLEPVQRGQVVGASLPAVVPGQAEVEQQEDGRRSRHGAERGVDAVPVVHDGAGTGEDEHDEQRQHQAARERGHVSSLS